MSASDKKKLRKEQAAASLTEKQKKEQQEAKKLKAYTLTFAVVMILVVAIVIGVVVTPFIDGAILRGSHSVTIGNHELSTADLTYFYIDSISEHQKGVYNQYSQSFGDYWSMMLGYETTKPLNEQIYDEESGKTWADYFMDSAIESAKSTYALYDDAVSNNYLMPEDQQKDMNSYLDTMQLYANYYGFSSVKSYLRSTYGNGATEDGYRNYYTLCTTASSYLNDYAEKLDYKADDYRAYEKDKYEDYTHFSFAHYTMKYESYLGTAKKDENGKEIPWTDAEKETARAAMNADLAKIMASEVTDKASFDKAIQSLTISQVDKDGKPIESSKMPTSTAVEDAFYKDIYLHAGALEWIKSSDCKAGDFKAFDVVTYATHSDPEHEHSETCGCAKTTDGYTIVLFTERNDNLMPLANVRHILVKFQGGTKNENGTTVYSEAEKNAAKTEAEKLLQQWKDGKANEESFGELANKESDDQNGKVTNGGLYEDITPGQMVNNFEDWCFAADRKAGDTGIVETEYGYHVMYYSSADEMTYRDYLIDIDMRKEDTKKWNDELIEKIPFTLISLDKMEYDYIPQ